MRQLFYLYSLRYNFWFFIFFLTADSYKSKINV